MRPLVAFVPLVLASCSLADGIELGHGLPYELRCYDLDAAECRARAAKVAAFVSGPGVVIEEIGIGPEGYGVCWRRPGPGPKQWDAGCADGVFPDEG